MKELILRWIAALKSGKYKKGICFLRTCDDKYCCLGVLCDLEGLRMASGEIAHHYEEETAGLPVALRKKYGLCIFGGKDGCPGPNLASVNDASDTFEPVIERIKEMYAKELAA